jgi:hypothetical protein
MVAPAAFAAEPSKPSGDPSVYKVVYHADFSDPRRFSMMLTNINNMANAYNEQLADYDIRIVFVSHGIKFLTDDKLAGTMFAEDPELKKVRAELLGRVQGLQQTQNIKLELCSVTKNAVRLDDKKLLPGVEVVRSGVVRIAELQRQGFAYLKIE